MLIFFSASFSICAQCEQINEPIKWIKPIYCHTKAENITLVRTCVTYRTPGIIKYEWIRLDLNIYHSAKISLHSLTWREFHIAKARSAYRVLTFLCQLIVVFILFVVIASKTISVFGSSKKALEIHLNLVLCRQTIEIKYIRIREKDSAKNVDEWTVARKCIVVIANWRFQFWQRNNNAAPLHCHL